MATQYRVDPRIRAYGKARIDVTRRAHDEREWQSLWREPRYPFPFTWGSGWKQCVQYTVEDFAAEIGFFIDVLGFPVSAFSPNYAQFTTPDQAFFFGVAAPYEGGQVTPPDSLSIQFMLSDLEGAIQQLEQRGIVFERKPETGSNSPPIAVLRSPHGVRIELWGTPQVQPVAQPEAVQSAELADFWADDEAGDELDVEEGANDGKNPAQMEFEDLEDDEEPEEPVYVDDEEAPQVEPPAQPPSPSKQAPPHPRPAFPTAIVRRTEDLLKDRLRIPGSRVRGNG